MTGEDRGRGFQQITFPLVEHAGLQLRGAADLRHRLLVHHVLPDQGRLLLGRVPPARPLAHDSSPFPPVSYHRGGAVIFRLRQDSTINGARSREGFLVTEPEWPDWRPEASRGSAITTRPK